MTALIIGWGNPIAGDDGLGWKAADLVREHVGRAGPAEVVKTAHGALRVAERMLGYDRVVVLDAAVDAEGSEIVRTVIRPQEIEATEGPTGHDGSLIDAVRALRRLRADGLPEEIVLYGAPIAAPRDWEDRPSAAMEEAAARLARAALAELVFGREGIADA